MNNPFKMISLPLSLLLLTISSLCQASPDQDPHQGMPMQGNTTGKIYGKVIETINTDNYTYVHVDTGKSKHWAAAPPVSLAPGSMVSFVPNMPMQKFYSKTLKREFDVVYFVGQIYTDKAGDPATTPAPHKSANKAPAQPVAGIKKAANGNTISEVLGQKQQLAGKTIHIRGKVVKYTPQVMGTNWIHIRDSSTAKDLTLTTAGTAKTGDVILVSGKLSLNKDFGFGYIYEVLLEDSSITVE